MSTRVHHESTGAVCRSNGHVTESEDWEEEDEGWTLKHVWEAWRQHWNHKNFTFLWKIIWNLNLQPTNNSWQFSVCDAAAETFHLRTRKLTACHYQNKESLSSYKMRACEAVNTVKAWLWLSVILLLCISHRSTFTVWLIVLLWNWKLQIRTNSSGSCMTLCDAHPSMFVWFLNQWSDSAALKRLHCTVMVCECAHIQTEKDSAW